MDGIVALQARAQDSGEADRAVTTRLLPCCFALVTHEDVDTEADREDRAAARVRAVLRTSAESRSSTASALPVSSG